MYIYIYVYIYTYNILVCVCVCLRVLHLLVSISMLETIQYVLLHYPLYCNLVHRLVSWYPGVKQNITSNMFQAPEFDQGGPDCENQTQTLFFFRRKKVGPRKKYRSRRSSPFFVFP